MLRTLIRNLSLQDSLILDAGCGTGFARIELGTAGTVIGLDSSIDAFATNREHTSDCVASVERTPFPDAAFDVVVALDLLEHLDDEETALRELYRVCKPGGHLFVTVPAYQWMWSRHDEALGHHRRYSAKDLRNKVRHAGFSVHRISYVVSTMFLAAAAYRCIRKLLGKEGTGTDLAPVPEPLNMLLSGLMRMEVALAWLGVLPFGLSVMLLARKDNSSASGKP